MEIIERVVGSAIVLDMRGRLYGVDVGSRLERIVERLGRAGRQTVIANLEHVSAVDAGGLGALAGAYRASIRNRVVFTLVRAHQRTRRLLVVTRLSRVLRTFDSLDEALDDERRLRIAPRTALFVSLTA